MVRVPMQIEGTWDQIAPLASSLTGRRLRLTVLDSIEEDAVPPPGRSLLSDQFADIRATNAAAWEGLPVDLAEQHDHYVYGWPKE